jgi:hypothetical protein
MGVHYTPEELDTPVTQNGEADVIEGVLEPTEDWAAMIKDAQTKEAVEEIVARAKAVGEFTDPVRTLALARYGAIGRAEEKTVEAEPVANEGEEVSEEEYLRREAAEYEAAVARGEVQP